MQEDRRVAILSPVHVHETNEQILLGGAERYLKQLYGLLCASGYEPQVWQPGARTHVAEGMSLRGLPEGDEEYETLPELNARFYEQTVGFTKAVYFAPMLAFPRLRSRAVVVAHMVGWDHPGHPWAHLAGPFKEEWLRRLRYALTAPDLLVSVDTNMLNWIRAAWPGYESRQAYIPNFVDTNLFHPAVEDRDKVVVLFPRRLHWSKGFVETAHAARLLLQRHGSIEFHFVAGQGTNDVFTGRVQRWTEENPGCRYYWVPLWDMPAVYRRADITLIPSLASEGTSLACLEAMSSGNAVVCGRVGGLTDLVIDGYNGRLINVTPEALVQAIEDLILHPEKRRRLGQKARETAEAFSLARWKERWARALCTVWGGSA